MAFGSMALRLVIDGRMQPGNRFTGQLSVKIFGVVRETPGVLTGSKIDLSNPTMDECGKAALLRHLLRRCV